MLALGQKYLIWNTSKVLPLWLTSNIFANHLEYVIAIGVSFIEFSLTLSCKVTISRLAPQLPRGTMYRDGSRGLENDSLHQYRWQYVTVPFRYTWADTHVISMTRDIKLIYCRVVKLRHVEQCSICNVSSRTLNAGDHVSFVAQRPCKAVRSMYPRVLKRSQVICP